MSDVISRPALVPSSYPPNYGGVERVVRELATGFQAHDMMPTVYTNQWPKDLRAAEVIDGVQVVRAGFRFPHPSVRGIAGWVLKSRTTRRQLLADAADRGCDLVNVHCISSNASYALQMARRLDVPLVVSVHGELSCDVDDAYGHHSSLRRTWRALMDAADWITAPSEFSLREAEQEYGRSFGPRTSVIRNGVDLALFSGAREEPTDRGYVFAVGRMVRTKGFDVLIDAWKGLPAALSDVELVIAGDGLERQALERRAEGMDAIRFTGAIDSAEVARRMRSASAFVLPSRAEALGLTVLEAMAAGVPVIASEVGGVPELVRHHETGLLVGVDDVPGLTRALVEVLTDAGAAEKRAATARGVADALSWANCVASFHDVYRRAS